MTGHYATGNGHAARFPASRRQVPQDARADQSDAQAKAGTGCAPSSGPGLNRNTGRSSGDAAILP